MKRTETTDDWCILGGRISYHELNGRYEVRYSIGGLNRRKAFKSELKAIRFYLKLVKSVLKSEGYIKRIDRFY